MFSFKKLLGTKKIGIIDIGSYKIKALVCEIKGKNLKILGYGEKRQEINDIINGEIANIEGVCNSIDDALKKASQKAGSSPKNIVLNIPTSSIIGEINEINYKRQHPSKQIDLDELDNIISKTENYSLKKAQNDIFKKTGYSDVDIKLVTTSITKILIDETQVTNPIGFTGIDANISLMNIFTPISKFNTIKAIGKYLDKNIEYIIPSEFAIPKIAEKTTFAFKDIVFVDIGNSRTRIIIQEKGAIKGFNIIDIGIDDLIRKISESYEQTRTDIIKNLNNDLYEEEKREFLDIWKDGLIFGIKEITGGSINGNNVYISGGGGVNSFIRDFIISDEVRHELGLTKNLKIISERVKYELEEALEESNISFADGVSKNLGTSITSLVIATSEIINIKKDVVIEVLKKVLEKIKI